MHVFPKPHGFCVNVMGRLVFIGERRRCFCAIFMLWKAFHEAIRQAAAPQIHFVGGCINESIIFLISWLPEKARVKIALFNRLDD